MVRLKIKRKVRHREGAKLLLQALWYHLGGVARVSEKASVRKQELINWRNRGKVPFERIGEIARRLGIDSWGLNYEDSLLYHGGGPSWDSVVTSYNLPKDEVVKILRGAKPRSYDKLIW